MVSINSRGFKSILLLMMLLASSMTVMPSKSASALAAWSINRHGILHLRTAKGVKLEAFFQSAGQGVGDRVWVDFPGELIRPRRIIGNGPIKEIRLGKPFKGQTRLVVEFMPSVDLDPKNLKLIGIAPDKWELRFVGLPPDGIKLIGEGDLISKNVRRVNSAKEFLNLDASSLPSVPRGKYRVVLDPGHGGSDPGAIGLYGLRETEIVLDVALKVSNLLSSKGVNVILTRRRNITLDLMPRVEKANVALADAFISIHANASRGSRRDVNGMETYYYSGNKGFTLAKNIQDQILRASPTTPDRGVRRSRFFVIRRTSMPAALVEIGFVTGKIDAAMLQRNSYREKIAFAISKGILNYLKESN